MKKIILILCLSLLMLVGCSKDEKETIMEQKATIIEETSDDTVETNGYVFENKGIIIEMHSEVEPIILALGDEKNYFEAESCAFQGIEKAYSYDGFDLFTYELEGVDYVAGITFLDDSVSTKEGIYLDDDLDSVLKAYGDNFTESLGLYSYIVDDSKISILIENNLVTSIEYAAIPK